MKTSLHIKKRLTSSAMATVIAASLLLTGSASAANPTPHPGRAGADTESITSPTWITNPTWRSTDTESITSPTWITNPTWRNAETQAVIHPSYVPRPDSVVGTEARAIVHPAFLINPDSMKPAET